MATVDDRDLEPLEPSYLPGEPPRPAGAPGPRPWAKALAIAIGGCALIVMAVLIVAGSRVRSAHEEREELAERLDRTRATVASLNRETDELRRRTRLPAIDLELSTVVVLPAADGVSAAVSVLIAPDDFSPVWLRVDAVGATPGTMLALSLGSCQETLLPSSDLVSAPASPDGPVTLLAGPLRTAPDDPDIWLRLHKADTGLGGLRGPLLRPRALRPDQLTC